MEAAVLSHAAVLSSSPLIAPRLRHRWSPAPAKQLFSPALSSATKFPFAPSPFLHGPAIFFSPSPPPLCQFPLLRLHGRVAAGAVLQNAAAAGAVLQNAAATALCFAGAYSLVLGFDALTERNLIQKSLSRKAVHVLSGLLYMSTWPLFSSSAQARYFAAVVPVLNAIRLLSYGLRLLTDDSLVKSVTREGKPEELLRGPLYYVITLLLCVLVFWRDSPVGIVSLALMSGGDGFADIVGRKYGVIKLPYNKQKSWIGSISMLVFGFLFSLGMLYYFSVFGYFHFYWEQTAARVALVSLVATIVESLPISDVIDDNISVPLTSMLTAFIVFGT